MSWTRSLLLNIAGGILVVLLLGNFALTLVNNNLNATLADKQADIQKGRTTVGQAQEVATRVVRYLQVIAARLNQATTADPQFKAQLTAADTSGIYAKFEAILAKAQAAAQAAQSAAQASPSPAAALPSPATP